MWTLTINITLGRTATNDDTDDEPPAPVDLSAETEPANEPTPPPFGFAP